MAEDFDRSFDFFVNNEKDDLWREASKQALDTTFDSSIFEFSATPSFETNAEDEVETGSLFFPDDPFTESSSPSSTIKVRVAIHEEICAMYDDFSQEGAITVTGSIHVKAAECIPFSLILNDAAENVQRIEEKPTVCSSLGKKKQVLKVKLDPSLTLQEVPIANYFCVPKLRPVPLLVKSRVSATKVQARAGFKIRANPNNANAMKKLVVMVAVPPDVDGETVKMSRKGVWEELKRTVTWHIDELEPGKALEIQAQFSLLGELDKAPKFPVLVRCDYPSLFSGVELAVDEGSSVKMKLTKSGRILHRKV